MTDRAQLMNQVWACVEQAFVVGDLERARGLDEFLTALEELAREDAGVAFEDPFVELPS